MTRLKVGVVGGGVGRGHIEAWQQLPDLFEVAAFCDIDRAKAEAVAGEFGIAAVDTDLDGLLARDLDLVDLCTPSGLHHAQTLQALAAGRHVVVEKPVARSLAEVDRMIEAEAASGRRVCPIFQYRFGHGFQKLLFLVAEGIAGAPSVATAETHWLRTPEYYAAGPWRGKWLSELGGCLTTHAIHIHDMLGQALGPLAKVHARAARRVNGNETEDMAVLSLAYAGGAFATSSVTLGSQRQTSRLRFCFSNLVAESGLDPYNPGHEPWTFEAEDAVAQRRIDEALRAFRPLPERFAGQFFRLHAALTAGAPLPVNLEEARAAIELLTAAYHSALTGEDVALPLAGDHAFAGGWVDTMRERFVHGAA